MPSLQGDCLHSFPVEKEKTQVICIGRNVMRALPILLVFVAILLTCEPSHTRPVKTGNANDPVQTCSFELPVTAEFRGTNFAWIVPPSGDLLYTWNSGGNCSEIG